MVDWIPNYSDARLLPLSGHSV